VFPDPKARREKHPCTIHKILCPGSLLCSCLTAVLRNLIAMLIRRVTTALSVCPVDRSIAVLPFAPAQHAYCEENSQLARRSEPASQEHAAAHVLRHSSGRQHCVLEHKMSAHEGRLDPAHEPRVPEGCRGLVLVEARR